MKRYLNITVVSCDDLTTSLQIWTLKRHRWAATHGDFSKNLPFKNMSSKLINFLAFSG